MNWIRTQENIIGLDWTGLKKCLIGLGLNFSSICCLIYRVCFSFEFTHLFRLTSRVLYKPYYYFPRNTTRGGVNCRCRNKRNFLRKLKLKRINKLKEHKRFLRGKTSWAQQEETTSTTRDFKLNTFTN